MQKQNPIQGPDYPITYQGPTFSFGVYWPYKEPFDPINSQADIHLQINNQTYVGSVITVRHLQVKEDRYKEGDLETLLLVPEITQGIIADRIKLLLEQNSLTEYFYKKRH